MNFEADNRLSWMLGRLDAAYGDNAYYVHLTRDRNQVTVSFARRADFGIMKAYREGILLHEGQEHASAESLAQDYIDTVEANIAHFLKDKRHTMEFSLEPADQDFRWSGTISAQKGHRQDVSRKKTRHNASRWGAKTHHIHP